jgi:hypothetical protein
MSFHGQKTGAWARPTGMPQNQQLNQSLFTNQLAFTGVPGMSLAPSIGALVNSAAFLQNSNVLQAAAAQRQLMPQSIQQPARQGSPPANRNQRTFVGTVTKIMETYGFVDDDVFFQTNVVRGGAARQGDRVLVEASYNPTMPFKWNAYRIQLMTNDNPGVAAQQQPQQQSSGGQRHGGPGGGGGGGRWAANDRSMRDDRQNAVDRHRQPSAQRRSPVRKVTPGKSCTAQHM